MVTGKSPELVCHFQLPIMVTNKLAGTENCTRYEMLDRGSGHVDRLIQDMEFCTYFVDSCVKTWTRGYGHVKTKSKINK